MQTVRKDVKSILHDTQVLKEDTFSLVRDVEHLERVVTAHWKEILLDFLCSLLLFYRYARCTDGRNKKYTLSIGIFRVVIE